MKKLMIAAAMAISAVVASASSVNWQVDLDDDSYDSGWNWVVVNGSGASTLAALLTDGNVDGFNQALANMDKKTGTFEEDDWGFTSGMFSDASSNIFAMFYDTLNPDDKF